VDVVLVLDARQRQLLLLLAAAPEQVTVELDLRNAQSGAYFLSTTHEQEKASYYYPLQIK
jgi:hypothetical protein